MQNHGVASENCINWQAKNADNCRSCYWAFPENYSHIAMRDIRRLDILWSDKEIEEYDYIKKEAENVQEELPEYVKNVLRSHFRKD